MGNHTKKKNTNKKAGKSGSKAAKTLQALAQNPLVADVVAAALVATASALKDSNRARRMAADVGDELDGLAKDGARRGNAMWKLALDLGRQALDEIGQEFGASKSEKPRSAPNPKKKPAAKPAKRTKGSGSSR